MTSAKRPTTSAAPATNGGRRYGGRTVAERNAERHARLLAAGLEAFGTRGYRATSIEQLCSAAGVATRNFYDELGSREALLIELHDEVNARAFDAVSTALAAEAPDDIAARVHAAFGAYLQVMTQDRRWARIAFVEMLGATPDTHEARRKALGRFADLVEAEITRMAEAGQVPRRDYSLAAIGAVGAFTAMVETLTPDAGPADVERVKDEGVRLLLQLLADPTIG